MCGQCLPQCTDVKTICSWSEKVIAWMQYELNVCFDVPQQKEVHLIDRIYSRRLCARNDVVLYIVYMVITIIGKALCVDFTKQKL